MNNYCDRFAIIRFPLIVLVVYLHAGDMPFLEMSCQTLYLVGSCL